MTSLFTLRMTSRRHCDKMFIVELDSGYQLYHLYLLNPLNPELNPICYSLALLAHDFLHVSR